MSVSLNRRVVAEAIGTGMLLAPVVGSGTFAGIRPADVPGCVVAQLAGALMATFQFRWLVPSLPETAERVVVPRSESAVR